MSEREVGARYDPETVEVAVGVLGTLWWWRFQADEVTTSDILHGGRGVVVMRGGRDGHGPVKSVQAGNTVLIIRRPGKGDGGQT